MHHLCAGTCRGQKAADLLELEAQVVVSPVDACAGNQTWSPARPVSHLHIYAAQPRLSEKPQATFYLLPVCGLSVCLPAYLPEWEHTWKASVFQESVSISRACAVSTLSTKPFDLPRFSNASNCHESTLGLGIRPSARILGYCAQGPGLTHK